MPLSSPYINLCKFYTPATAPIYPKEFHLCQLETPNWIRLNIGPLICLLELFFLFKSEFCIWKIHCSNYQPWPNQETISLTRAYQQLHGKEKITRLTMPQVHQSCCKKVVGVFNIFLSGKESPPPKELKPILRKKKNG